jgi:hypothetical protein
MDCAPKQGAGRKVSRKTPERAVKQRDSACGITLPSERRQSAERRLPPLRLIDSEELA